MNYKIAFWVALILLGLGILFYFLTKPSTVQLQRAEQEEQDIIFAEQIIAGKDTIISHLKDSLEESRKNVRVIIKTSVVKEKEIIEQPVTEQRIRTFKTFLNEHYLLKTREIGFESPAELSVPQICLSQQEFKGGELLINSYNTQKSLNFQLNRQVDLLTISNDTQESKIEQLYKIINLKESQLRKLEGIKIPVINSRKWYVDVGIVTGSLAVGFVAGIIYKNSK